MSETNGTNGVTPKLDADKLTLLEPAQRTRVKRLAEAAAMDFYGILGAGFDPYDMYQDMSGWNSYPYVPPPWYRQHQKRGEVLPVYLDENQLRFLRDRSRKLWQENVFVKCAVLNMQNYVAGADGMTIKAVSASERRPVDKKWLGRVQDVVDMWSEVNERPEVEADIIERMIVDGEKFLRHFPMPKGIILLRDVEAEHIKSPPGGSFPPHSSFGIETDPEDVHTRRGYHVVEHPITNPLPTFVPAADICHIKWNTPRSSKRGLPLFYECETLLRDAVDLLRGVVVTANIRARYAVIRKFTSPVIKEAVQKFLNEVNLATVTDPTTGQDINVERKPFGGVTNAGANIDYEFPNASMDNNDYEIALQMVLRAIAARIGFPEFMLTADAGNANFASTLVAESPSVKMFEMFQNRVKRRVAEYRMEQKRSLAWTQIVYAVRIGILPPETLTVVKLQAEGPSLVVRDQQGEAETNGAYNALKIKSRKTISMEQNLDFDQEQAQLKQEAIEDLEMQQRMGLAALGGVGPMDSKNGKSQGASQAGTGQSGGEAPTSAPPGSAGGASVQKTQEGEKPYTRAELLNGKGVQEGWMEVPDDFFRLPFGASVSESKTESKLNKSEMQEALAPIQSQLKELCEELEYVSAPSSLVPSAPAPSAPPVTVYIHEKESQHPPRVEFERDESRRVVAITKYDGNNIVSKRIVERDVDGRMLGWKETVGV